ncbi:MAG: hypothetical protein ACSNEK_02810 [Parachlamydiaceae bacterium]
MNSTDAFLPTKVRLLCICQLCFGFATLLWVLSSPFLGALYHYKSQLIVYESVLGDEQATNLLSTSTLNNLQAHYQVLKKALQTTFAEKWMQATSLLLTLSSFKLAWIILSIALPIALLLKLEGSNQLLWLLPFLTLLFAIENQSLTKHQPASLFPSEHYLVTKYLNGLSTGSIREQYNQLKKAWSDYLVIEWAKETPSQNIVERAAQEKKGLLLFNADRLIKSKSDNFLDLRRLFQQKSSPVWLIVQVIWNILFCLYARIPRQEFAPAR